MKVYLKVAGSSITHYYLLVDENGDPIENVVFTDFSGTKTIYTLNDDYDVTYIQIAIPTKDLFLDKKDVDSK